MSSEYGVIEKSKVRLEDGTVRIVKTCPDCGSTDAYIQHSGGKFQIRCWWDLSCKCRSGWFDSLSEAITKWNRGVNSGNDPKMS